MSATMTNQLNITATAPIKRWLFLGVFALAGAGIFSILPLLLRSPTFAKILPFEDFFTTALVTHVNLSVLVWMLASACILWELLAQNLKTSLPDGISKASFYAALAGTLLFTIVPFLGDTHPLKNNYVPVLQHPLFFLGLGLFTAGIFLRSVTLLPLLKPLLKKKATPLEWGIYSTLPMMIITYLCFLGSYLYVPPIAELGNQLYYELIFWNGGHVLIYVYTQVLLIAWVLTAIALGYQLPFSDKWLSIILLLNLILVLPLPILYLVTTDISSDLHVTFFTEHMRYGGGIAAILVGLALVIGCMKRKGHQEPHAVHASLFFSFLLFMGGGLIGFMISGHNVTIPAHYHGSIVGISVALMGLIYYLTPQLGLAPIRRKLAATQPYFYGGGQMLHIIGLAWMGGYGALRKTANTVLTADAKIGMVMFIIGGLFAIIGGLLFVIVMVDSWARKGE